MNFRILALITVIFSLFISVPSFAEGRGILVLAHGVASHSGGHGGGHGHPPKEEGPWEKTVRELVGEAEKEIPYPVELAFGMWNRESFQHGVDALLSEGVTELRVIPLFVSSHSMVIRAQRYMFQLSDENPLPWMDPGKVELSSQIAKVEFASALDDSVEVSGILNDRVAALSVDPSSEEVILVAHGPVSDEDDAKWLSDLQVHAHRLKMHSHARVMTLRDDAPKEIRDEMTRRLRAMVQEISTAGKRALVIPVLLASGGIEAGLIKRLEQLTYEYSGEMLAPHPELIRWLVKSADSE